ncbi:glycosyltransferase family 4 protein [Acinetobacter terrae]|uniref:glycosyltransferase family 4 protein n=1 Tax=Acinetobacter terrae TaxID=2731247 RepID=UPI0007D76434|nr:glycosyltransferase family 4 protein [Acinetobacter terrae]OAL77418.1 glycosyltransferase WbuB [Acinetobacter terrae]OTG75947.1 glycosyltransferase WbuB [Acinetobacter terrae]
MSEHKVFWFINQYSSTPETAMGGRHYYLAQELAKKGHQVYIIAGSYSHLLRHPKKIEGEYLIENIMPNFNFVWVKLPNYGGAHSKERIINEFRFAWKLRKIKNIIDHKPNAILYSSPALIGYLGAKKLADFFDCSLIFEVRDPWPLTLVELGGYSNNHPFIKLLQWIEDRAYKRADFVFSNFFNAIEHMQLRGLDKVKFHWIPNGVSLQEVEKKEPLDIKIIKQIPKDKFIIGYTGTIGIANAMDYLIEAAQLVAENNHIHFVLVGDGKEKENLIQKMKEKSLSNITFIESIPKKQIQSILEKFDVCYIGWQKNKMYRLGVAANKLPEYLYSGKPIIHSFSGAGDFVQQANAGISIEAEDPLLIAQAIQQMYQLTDQERSNLGKNGRKFVLQHLDYTKLADKLERIIFQDFEEKNNETFT